MAVALILCIAFMAAEIAGGIFSKSLALITDAAHLASDVTSIVVVLYTTHLSMKSAESSHTFGYHRAEVLGSLISVLILLLVTGMLVIEALQRLVAYSHGELEQVDGKVMTMLAIAGIMVNLFCLVVLGVHGGGGHDHDHGDEHNHDDHEGHDHEHDHDHEEEEDDHGHGGGIGFQSIVVHIIGDIVQSVGVVIAGIVIWIKPEWSFIDPICTLFFALLVCFTTSKITREIIDIMMERAPRDVNMALLVALIKARPGIAGAHDLHVWQIKPGSNVMSLHVTVRAGFDPHQVVDEVTSVAMKAGIGHVTVQCDPERNNTCALNV